MYGTQTAAKGVRSKKTFENDVEMYGTQTSCQHRRHEVLFENDVEMYGTQTTPYRVPVQFRLRMM